MVNFYEFAMAQELLGVRPMRSTPMAVNTAQ
jgi:hypothetical protein